LLLLSSVDSGQIAPTENTQFYKQGAEVMIANGRRSAFTLIEILVVVIVMALLAATIIPQFSSSTIDAKISSLNFNLHTMRSQIELYKVHHNGKAPELNKFLDQMTKPTNISGDTTGSDLIYGPYISGQIPANSFNGKNALVAVTTQGVRPTGINGTDAGWQYDQTTGGFFPNNEEFFTNL